MLKNSTINWYEEASDYFNKKIEEILSILPNWLETSESLWLVHFKFDMNWKERNSLNYWRNVVKTTIKSIIDVFLPEIYKKIKEKKMKTNNLNY